MKLTTGGIIRVRSKLCNYMLSLLLTCIVNLLMNKQKQEKQEFFEFQALGNKASPLIAKGIDIAIAVATVSYTRAVSSHFSPSSLPSLSPWHIPTPSTALALLTLIYINR